MNAGTILLALLALAAPLTAAEPLKVIATIPTYGELAREIGGDLVDVVVMARPTQDLHSVSATPAVIARVRGADLLLYTGLDAELWLPDLLRVSENVHLLPGSEDAINLSSRARLKQVPVAVSRAQGDQHIFGNPHVWTDPMIVRAQAEQVRDALVRKLPDAAEAIVERHAGFHRRLTEALVRWLTDYADLAGEPVVIFHASWVYFLDRFGLDRVATIEPKPRVPPTPSHLEELAATMRERGVRVVVREPYQHPKATEFVAEATGATVVTLSTHPGFPAEAADILSHFEHNLRTLAEAVRDR